MEAESKSRRLETEAREAVKRAVRVEAERDAARHEVVMARLEIEAAGRAQAQVQVESELARVQLALASSEDSRRKVESELDGAQQALTASGEAWRKAEEEVSLLIDERVSLLVELEASKDELSAFRAGPLKRRRLWRRSLTLALKLSSIMAMVSMHLHTIFVGVSPGSRLGCLTRQSCYHLSFLLILDAP